MEQDLIKKKKKIEKSKCSNLFIFWITHSDKSRHRNKKILLFKCKICSLHDCGISDPTPQSWQADLKNVLQCVALCCVGYLGETWRNISIVYLYFFVYRSEYFVWFRLVSNCTDEPVPPVLNFLWRSCWDVALITKHNRRGVERLWVLQKKADWISSPEPDSHKNSS